MTNNFWSNVIDTLKYIDPKVIDKDEIKIKLKYDRDVTMEVLDSLYTIHIITIDEYIEFFKQIIKIQEDRIKYQKDYLRQAEEKREEYNPMAHYCCAFPFSYLDTSK